MTPLIFAAMLMAPQEKLDPSEAPPLPLADGSFSVQVPRGFAILMIDEQGRETNELVRFQANVGRTAVVKITISKFNNSRGLTLEQWAQQGRISWATEPGYQEFFYRTFEHNKDPGYVHEFRFHLTNASGQPTNKFRVKSVRLFRHNQGYWFTFYATVTKFEEFVGAFDKMVRSVKFRD